MTTFQPTRRTALALMGATAVGAAVSGGLGFPRLALAAGQPWLATPQQIAAERTLLELLNDPEIKRIQAEARAALLASPRGQIPDAAATVDRAIALWTNSLIFGELAKNVTRPAFLWGTDDTPREWLGHRLAGVGTSGDNPDAIYRVAGIEGSGRYEIIGQYHPEGRPTQVLMEVNVGDMARPQNVMPTAGGKHQDIVNAAQINQDQFVVAADGSFRITLASDPAARDAAWASPNHLTIPNADYALIGVRDILSDWGQRASRLTINRLDPVTPRAFGIEEVRALVRADLPGFLRFWSNFPNIWFGGLKPNTHSAPQQRPGGWGFVAGLNYHLGPDEALLVTTTPGGAKYTGFQVIDPWMIAPDARAAQVSLNGSQAVANPDGTVTYVIAARDPGTANWLDTTGLRDGYGILRWQAVPPELKGDGLIRDFRVVKLGELAAAKPLPRVAPAERKARVAARKAGYETRVR